MLLEHCINNTGSIKSCIEVICSEALEKVKQLRKKGKLENDSYKLGLKTAFWLHQYANSSLILKEDFANDKKESFYL